MNELYHHGVKGMHWGVRRYQNADGTLTAAGKKRYNTDLDSLHGYSRLAGSKAVSAIRRKQAYSNELNMAYAKRAKAGYQARAQELNDIDRIAAKYGGIRNTKLARAGRGVQRIFNDANLNIKKQEIAEGKKKQSKLSEMDVNAQRYRSDHSKSMTKEQKAAERRGRINYAVDNQVKAIGAGAVSAGSAFAASLIVKKMYDKVGFDSSDINVGKAAAKGFVTGYAGANIAQLMMDSGMYKTKKK